ncbi:RICIN domain-containing protein [Leekyejoonella antrihumi]|uniref:Ricin B lectin domain-containing protein n=1 Tax=Leekyejoonella antrihumi TaxID=1660198 RepID=A0A563E624_9MICO|nr:RICIN domain-containing protein [Leekyejoonella antrihumi]TWP37294.1 hypothetical protein FGL98_05920 [Leekyejoonella antrihumi]
MFRTTTDTTATVSTTDSPVGARSNRRRGLRRVGTAAGLAACSAVLIAAGAGTASASTAFTTHLTPNNTFYLQLDVSGASTAPGAPVIDWWSNGGANQAWSFIDAGGGSYEIVNQNSGQCLTTDGVAGDQLYQYPCWGGWSQLWNTGLNPGDLGAVATMSNPETGLDVDVDGNSPWPGAAIDAWYPNGGANQSFSTD